VARVLLLNKVDVLPPEGRIAAEAAYPDAVLVSARTGEGLDDVKRRTLMARAERAAVAQ